MNSQVVQIPIDKLVINPNNYRFESVNNETEAISIMLKENNKKIISLIEHIIKNGINPSESLIVTESDGKYLVLEGNRRLTAVKILNNPYLLEEISKTLFNQYTNIINKHKNIPTIKSLNCAVASNPDEADVWIKLKHTGENSGAGTVMWDTHQKRRFDESNGKSDFSYDLIKYISTSDFYRNDIKANIKKIKITNLHRLISDPNVRESIGLSLKQGKLYKNYPDSEISKGLSRILTTLLEETFSVKSIYLKPQRIEYISNFDDTELPDPKTKLNNPVILSEIISDEKDKIIHIDDQIRFDNIVTTTNNNNNNNNNNLNIANTSNTNNNNNNNLDILRTTNSTLSTYDNASNSNNIDSPTSITPPSDIETNVNISNNSLSPADNNNLHQTIKTRTNDARDINNRKYLIPTTFNVKIKDPRTNQIYKELKSLEITRYTNTVAISFRVFLEFSIDKFLESNSVDGIHSNTKLKDKIQKSLNYLKENSLITKDEAKPVNTCIASPNSIFSVDTFNSYVHNPHMFPDVLHLKTTWNQLSNFIRILHQNI